MNGRLTRAFCLVMLLGMCGPARSDEPKSLPDHPRQLVALLVPQTPLDVQLAAVDALGRSPGAQTARLLLSNWENHGPRVHRAVVAALLWREPWTPAVAEGVENQRELAASLDWARRDVWIRHRSAEVRARAGELLRQRVVRPEIRESIARFRGALQMSGNAVRGRRAFEEATCSNCHKIGEVGRHVGPDLTRLIDRSPYALLIDTVDPNRLVHHAYVEYTAVTVDGQQLRGMLFDEDERRLTLADQNGELRELDRDAIDELVSNHRSQMPEGLEARLTLQQMADLIGFMTAVESTGRISN